MAQTPAAIKSLIVYQLVPMGIALNPMYVCWKSYSSTQITGFQVQYKGHQDTS